MQIIGSNENKQNNVLTSCGAEIDPRAEKLKLNCKQHLERVLNNYLNVFLKSTSRWLVFI